MTKILFYNKSTGKLFDFPRENIFLKDKVVLVTYAHQGIGTVLSKSFSKLQAKVILIGDSIIELNKLYNDINFDNAQIPSIYPINFANATVQNLVDLIESIKKYYGRLDGIFFNSTMCDTFSPIEFYSFEKWYKHLQINLNSFFMLIKIAIPLLKERSSDSSVIFNIMKLDCKNFAYLGAFACVNSAIKMLFKILFHEHENISNIRFNLVESILINTKTYRNLYPGMDFNSFCDPALLQYI